MCRLRDADITTKLTLAPRWGSETVYRIVKLGVIVSIGHTVASNAQTWVIGAGSQLRDTFDERDAAVDQPHPGPVVAIMNAGLACGIICDGIHVQDEMIKLALLHMRILIKFLGFRLMPTIGGPDQFDLYDMTVRLTEGHRSIQKDLWQVRILRRQRGCPTGQCHRFGRFGCPAYGD